MNEAIISSLCKFTTGRTNALKFRPMHGRALQQKAYRTDIQDEATVGALQVERRCEESLVSTAASSPAQANKRK